ncbi:MAG: N-acetylmuramoyl-L-alanine amidase [Cyanobacteriota bacterium]
MGWPHWVGGWTWHRTGGTLALLLLLSCPAPAARAASSLAAWRWRGDRLELRTPAGLRPLAFYEQGTLTRGPRVWIDLPGAPSRTRTVTLPPGSALREVRIGRPSGDLTRLVLEFQSGTSLDPRDLRLVGTASDRWEMEFRALAALPTKRELPAIGEGDVEAPLDLGSRQPQISQTPLTPFPTDPRPLSAAGLPTVPRGRFKVVIDPGHGGPDPGAVGIAGLRETDVVLDVALQVAQLLQSRGVQVLLTRTTEVDVDLPPRVALANGSGADLFLSLHANALAMDRPDVNGIETFFFESAPSRALASAVQDQVLAVSPGSPDRGVRQARFFVIRRTTMPSSLLEMGFVTGNLDAPRLADPAHRRRLALAVAAGILQYLGQLAIAPGGSAALAEVLR